MEKDLLENKEKPWGKRISWIVGIVGLIATIVFGAISLIDKEPKLEYDIISVTDLFNTQEPTSYIKVFIEDSIDVQEKHYNITTYSIKVENIGSKHISYHDYDEGFFGLRIENGTLLENPHLASASSDHIERNFHTDTTAKGHSKIYFPKLSLDIGDNYVVKIVLLRKTDSIPKFYPEGKITGQKCITINYKREAIPSFWSNRLAKSCLTIFASLLLAYTIITLISKNQDKKWRQESEMQKIVKKQKEKQYREDEIKELLHILPSIKEDYINDGDYKLWKLDWIFRFENESETTEKYRKLYQFITRREKDIDEEDFNRVKEEYDNYNYYIEKCYLILHQDISITYNKEAQESILKLYDFLKEKRKAENTYRSINKILNSSL